MTHALNPSEIKTLLTNLDEASSAMMLFAIVQADGPMDLAVLAEFSIRARKLDIAFDDAVEGGLSPSLLLERCYTSVQLTDLLDDTINAWIGEYSDLARLYEPFFSATC